MGSTTRTLGLLRNCTLLLVLLLGLLASAPGTVLAQDVATATPSPTFPGATASANPSASSASSTSTSTRGPRQNGFAYNKEPMAYTTFQFVDSNLRTSAVLIALGSVFGYWFVFGKRTNFPSLLFLGLLVCNLFGTVGKTLPRYMNLEIGDFLADILSMYIGNGFLFTACQSFNWLLYLRFSMVVQFKPMLRTFIKAWLCLETLFSLGLYAVWSWGILADRASAASDTKIRPLCSKTFSYFQIAQGVNAFFLSAYFVKTYYLPKIVNQRQFMSRMTFGRLLGTGFFYLLFESLLQCTFLFFYYISPTYYSGLNMIATSVRYWLFLLFVYHLKSGTRNLTGNSSQTYGPNVSGISGHGRLQSAKESYGPSQHRVPVTAARKISLDHQGGYMRSPTPVKMGFAAGVVMGPRYSIDNMPVSLLKKSSFVSDAASTVISTTGGGYAAAHKPAYQVSRPNQPQPHYYGRDEPATSSPDDDHFMDDNGMGYDDNFVPAAPAAEPGRQTPLYSAPRQAPGDPFHHQETNLSSYVSAAAPQPAPAQYPAAPRAIIRFAQAPSKVSRVVVSQAPTVHMSSATYRERNSWQAPPNPSPASSRAPVSPLPPAPTGTVIPPMSPATSMPGVSGHPTLDTIMEGQTSSPSEASLLQSVTAGEEVSVTGSYRTSPESGSGDSVGWPGRFVTRSTDEDE
ncbi:uncharacterized protein EV422DRAFT_264751 [Fimicolochytrium jonesii]|uniref:uncharacterized protein n=1 Tax=Fimicolochytrium jonesii TaxID=1396493 RepID=UPI0022FE3BA8|nr:uncharacterized protein EV422DRAFT_264751 [Fimicolochytrium jonesii]KAI8817101.1 hypothetical protein EV422DRAFT_264751 [Fimicolochytrium jonesii]